MRLAPLAGLRPVFASCAILALVTFPLLGQATLTQEEALRLAFPAPLAFERHSAFLSDSQFTVARELAGQEADLTQRVISYYLGGPPGHFTAVAYFDAHTVRSAQEVVMVVVGADHAVQRVEILRFDEPAEYRPPARWLDQLRAKSIDSSLAIRKDIINLTGATLTSRAVVRAIRRVLSLDRVIHPLGSTR